MKTWIKNMLLFSLGFLVHFVLFDIPLLFGLSKIGILTFNI